MMITTVVFDIGGVLELDVIEKSGNRLNIRWEHKLGFPSGEIDKRMKSIWHAGSLGLCTEEQVHLELEQRLCMSAKHVDEYMYEMWDLYCGRLNVPIANFFCSLRPRYQTAILSNSFVGARREEMQRYHFDEMCDLVIYTHEEGIAKPDSRIFELTCKRLHVVPEQVLFVDDNEENIVSARKLGIHTVLFRETEQTMLEVNYALGKSY